MTVIKKLMFRLIIEIQQNNKKKYMRTKTINSNLIYSEITIYNFEKYT